MQIRRIGAGFLAGASSLAGVLVFLVLLLFASGILSLIRDIAMEVHGDISLAQAIGAAFVQSVQSLPGYFWSARWGMLALGLLGMLLALVDAQRPRLKRRWRNTVGYVVTNSLVAAVVMGVLYANQEGLYRLVAEQPNLFTQQAALLVSDTTLLFVGLLITLGLGYVVWASWQWWYDRWALWLGVARPAVERAPAPAMAASSGDDWRSHHERVMRSKRPTGDVVAPVVVAPVAERSWLTFSLAGIVAAMIVLYGLVRVYNGVGPGVTSGEFWLEANAPTAATGLSFKTQPQSLTVSNTAGDGQVDVRVSGSNGTQSALDGMVLAGGVGFQSANLDLRGLSPGDYRLDMALRAGKGGLMRYVVLFGGGWQAQLVGAALGLVAGLWVGITNVALLEWLASRGSYGR